MNFVRLERRGGAADVQAGDVLDLGVGLQPPSEARADRAADTGDQHAAARHVSAWTCSSPSATWLLGAWREAPASIASSRWAIRRSSARIAFTSSWVAGSRSSTAARTLFAAARDVLLRPLDHLSTVSAQIAHGVLSLARSCRRWLARSARRRRAGVGDVAAARSRDRSLRCPPVPGTNRRSTCARPPSSPSASCCPGDPHRALAVAQVAARRAARCSTTRAGSGATRARRRTASP